MSRAATALAHAALGAALAFALFAWPRAAIAAGVIALALVFELAAHLLNRGPRR